MAQEYIEASERYERAARLESLRLRAVAESREVVRVEGEVLRATGIERIRAEADLARARLYESSAWQYYHTVVAAAR